MKLPKGVTAAWEKVRKQFMRAKYRDGGESQRLIMWGMLAIALLVAAGVLMGIANGSQQGVALLFPLVGTFLGAALAFAANISQEKTKREREAREAMHRAVYVLIVQHNEIANYIQYWPPFESLSDMAFNLPAFQPSEKFDLRQNIDSLGFLLRGDADDRNHLFRLTVEQQRFDTCLQAIRQRNDFYVNQVQPLLERHFQQGQEVNNNAMRQALGVRVYEGAVNGMRTILQHLTDSNKSLVDMHEDCLKVGEKLFGPKLGLTKYTLPEAAELPAWIEQEITA